MSFFELVHDAPPIEVYALTEACNEDKDTHKVNLGVGAYRTNEGKPWVLPVVRTVESLMAADHNLDKEYLPVSGIDIMCKSATKLVLGEDCKLIASKKGISLLVRLDIKEYCYWDPSSRKVNFTGMLEDLNKAPERAIVILHACAHNPTGTDLSHDQWNQLALLIKEKKLFPVFDMAYQGFASGNLDNDAWAVRLFASMGMEMFIAQSFSKNFGLYRSYGWNLINIVCRIV
uniref:aspartate transaminase n=1 Tax=Schistosoma haematobium TaxID=6185 RepID=A0A094ZDU3_SCHHA